MAYRIEIHRHARQALRLLPEKVRGQIARAIDGLANDPFIPGSKALKGKFHGLRRTRAGDYRIIYRVDTDRLVILVIRIAHRREVYR